ncbi:MAG: hypothetical protein K0B85_07055 [Coriobacteriia bacterium]|nr:hypothetical protein [Coriobacteriia bacterium]
MTSMTDAAADNAASPSLLLPLRAATPAMAPIMSERTDDGWTPVITT